MKRIAMLLFAAVCLQLTGCAGVPLLSAMKLANVNFMEILESDPTQLALALNVDAAVSGSREKRPLLHLKIEPKISGDFDKFERELDFELATLDAESIGLPAKTKNRSWLIYRLSPAAVKGIRDHQAYMEKVRQRKEKKGGGNLDIFLDNEWLIEMYPQYSDTDVQIWLRWNARDGFLKAWAGRLSAAKKT